MSTPSQKRWRKHFGIDWCEKGGRWNKWIIIQVDVNKQNAQAVGPTKKWNSK